MTPPQSVPPTIWRVPDSTGQKTFSRFFHFCLWLWLLAPSGSVVRLRLRRFSLWLLFCCPEFSHTLDPASNYMCSITLMFTYIISDILNYIVQFCYGTIFWYTFNDSELTSVSYVNIGILTPIHSGSVISQTLVSPRSTPFSLAITFQRSYIYILIWL